MLNNKDNIQIAMLEVSDRNKSILDFYFNSAGKKHYTLVDEDEADAFIMDYDYPGASSHLAEMQAEYKKPAILLSIREQSIPSTIWLAKPLSAQALTQAADQISQMLQEPMSFAETAVNEEILDTVTEESAEPQVELKEESAPATVQEPVIETNTNIETTSDDPERVDNEVLGVETDLIDTEVLDEEFVVEQDDVGLVSADTADIGLGGELLQETGGDLVADLEDGEASLELDLDIDLGSTIEDIELNDSLLKTASQSESEQEPAIDLIDLSNTETITEAPLEVEEPEKDLLAGVVAIGAGAVAGSSLASESENESLDVMTNDSLLDISAEPNELATDEPSLDTETAEEENEVDALLASLISSEEQKTKELQEAKEESSNADESVDTEFDLELVDSEDEIPSHADNVIPITGKKADAEVDEDFLMHDDLNPSKEDVFADTLEVDYKDLKADLDTSDVIEEAVEEPEVDLAGLSLEEDPEKESEVERDESETFEAEVLAEHVPSSESTMNFPSLEGETVEVVTGLTNGSNLEAEMIGSGAQAQPSALDKEDDLSLSLAGSMKEGADTDEDSIEAELDDLLQDLSGEDDSQAAEQSISQLEDDVKSDITGAVTGTVAAAAVTAVASQTPQANSNELDAESIEEVSEQELQSLLNEIQQENSGMVGGDGGHKKTKAERRWAMLCGELEDIKNKKQAAQMSFIAEEHLLSVLLNQIEQSKNSSQVFRVKYNDLIVVIDHIKNRIYCNLSLNSGEYAEICLEEIDHQNIKIHDLDYSEIRLYRNKMEEHPERTHLIELFIWTSSLLTSRGRLPAGTEINKKVGLKAWPDLTRLELMPHAMNIAAVFSKHPGSLLQVPKWLNIPQRYVFAFYNAALSLNMIELDNSKMKKSTFSFDKKDSKAGTKERGLFSRLLKRLKS